MIVTVFMYYPRYDRSLGRQQEKIRPVVGQIQLQECLSICVGQTAKKPSNPPSALFPTVAQFDHIQNGLILPRDPKNLDLILRDVDAKGYLDIELVYRLRPKESLGSVKQQIVRKIQTNQSAFCFEQWVRETLEEVSLKAV